MDAHAAPFSEADFGVGEHQLTRLGAAWQQWQRSTFARVRSLIRARDGFRSTMARIVIRRRMELGLTQEELAARMGTSHSAISRIESGQHSSSVQTLRRLAAALEMCFVMGFEHGPAEKPVRELVPS